jgi:hypothetical protein
MLAIAGVTVTKATGTPVTVMVAVPLFPSLVAVTVAAPAATPVTTPLAETLATAPLLLVQLTTRPVSWFPAESLVTATSGTVAPTPTLADAGLTATAATGAEATCIVGLSWTATSVMLFQRLSWVVPLHWPWPTMRT